MWSTVTLIKYKPYKPYKRLNVFFCVLAMFNIINHFYMSEYDQYYLFTCIIENFRIINEQMAKNLSWFTVAIIWINCFHHFGFHWYSRYGDRMQVGIIIIGYLDQYQRILIKCQWKFTLYYEFKARKSQLH